jgi:hypothetical protein
MHYAPSQNPTIQVCANLVVLWLQEMLGNGMVAIKMLNETLDVLENKFNEEVGCSVKTKHKNVMGFLGYCSHTREILGNSEEKSVMADAQQRLLCFDFLPHGSLDKYTIGTSIYIPTTCLYIFTFRMNKFYMVKIVLLILVYTILISILDVNSSFLWPFCRSILYT